jgi:hypothetical protein
VGREYDGLPGGGERLDARDEGAAGLDVHSDGGLVEEEDLGLPQMAKAK